MKHLEQNLSKRAAQIDEHLKKVGYSSYRARRIAALATSKLHDEADSDTDLMERWRNELARAGWRVDRLAKLVGPSNVPGTLAGPLSEAEINQLAAEVFDPDGMFLKRHRAFTRTHLLAEIGHKLYGHDRAELDRVLDRVLATDHVVIPLPCTPGACEQAYSLRGSPQ